MKFLVTTKSSFVLKYEVEADSAEKAEAVVFDEDGYKYEIFQEHLGEKVTDISVIE